MLVPVSCAVPVYEPPPTVSAPVPLITALTVMLLIAPIDPPEAPKIRQVGHEDWERVASVLLLLTTDPPSSVITL